MTKAGCSCNLYSQSKHRILNSMKFITIDLSVRNTLLIWKPVLLGSIGHRLHLSSLTAMSQFSQLKDILLLWWLIWLEISKTFRHIRHHISFSTNPHTALLAKSCLTLTQIKALWLCVWVGEGRAETTYGCSLGKHTCWAWGLPAVLTTLTPQTRHTRCYFTFHSLRTTVTARKSSWIQLNSSGPY